MAQKPNFLKKLISAGLVTASTAAFITAASSTAMGAAVARVVTGDAVFSTGANMGAGPVPVPANSSITLQFDSAGAWTTNVDVAGVNIQAIDTDQGNNAQAPGIMTLNQNVTIGSISHTGAGGNLNLLPIALNGKTANFTGTAGAGIAANIYDSLGQIDGAGANSTATFNLAGTTQAAPAILTNASVANGGTLTLNVTKGFIQVVDQTFAAINTINIGDGQGLIINSKNAAVGGNLALQANGGTINFNGTDGTGRLVLLANAVAGGAVNFVSTGNLGGAGKGIIDFNTTAVAGQLNANAGAAAVVVGTNNAAGRAQELVVTATLGNAATINGAVYSKKITLNGGLINFAGVIDVGADGTTVFKAANASTVTVAAATTLGGVDFANSGSQIIVAPGQTLTGNFIGDANNDANTSGVISFAGAGTLASASEDATVPVTAKVTAIQAIGAAAVNLSGIHNAELRLANAGASFNLADGTIINGGVNQTAPVGGALAAGSITLVGDATITGNIGGAAAPAVAVGNITLANDATKTLTLGGANIIGAGGANVAYAANGGNVVLTNSENNVVFNYNLDIATNQKGVFDVSEIANGKTVTISGRIGTIAANANKTLGQLDIGSSKTILNSGDVAINELVIGNNGSVQFGHDNYLITETTNAAGQGKIIINPNTAVVANNTNLVEGTNLGSAENPLSEINFGSANETVLNVGKNVNLYAFDITTATPNNGSFNFNGGGTNLVVGVVGAENKALNNVTVANGTTAEFAGPAIFNGVTSIDNTSTLVITNDYTAGSIIGAGADNGTLQFSNLNPITVTLNTQAAPVNALAAINVQGSDITFATGANNGGNPGINTGVVNFKSIANVFLPEGSSLDGLTINSTITGNNISNIPGIFVNGADSTIANNAVIGSSSNIVGLGLASDNGITVQLSKLYAVIGTTVDSKGTVTLSGGAGNTPGIVYGLGAEGLKLKSVTVTTNYQNLGNTAAVNLVVNDGLTYQTGGSFGLDFDGTITLGNANGNSTVVFADGINSTETSTVAAAKVNNGIATYLGDANVGNIGSADAALASTRFTGQNKKATLQGDIYSQTIDFGTNNLVVNTNNAILSGNTIAINNNINVQDNVLIFASGTTTWGANTSVTTTLDVAEGVLGSIEIADGATVNAQDGIALNINVVNDNAANATTTQNYTLVEGGKNFKGSFATPTITGGNRFLAYSVIRDNNQDFILTRSNNIGNVLKKDILSSQYANVPGISGNVDTFLNSPNTAAYKNLLLAKNSADSAKFVGSIVTDTSAVVQEDLLNTAKLQQAQLTSRLDSLRYLGSYESAEMASAEGGAVPQAAVAAGDEPVDNVAYGAWLKPFYAEAHQKAKGGVAGYKSKTTGGVIGLDTLANDNLMIGAAFGVTKTDIKHQDYKKGDKTEVTGTSFSLYAAQQLVNNFFAQGSAIFNLNHVKNKSQRYFFSDNGNANKQIAAGNYDNMTFGGKLMVGYDASIMDGLLLTPVAGLSYLKSSDESYKETGTTVANKQVNSKFGDRTDLIAGARLMGGTMNLMDFALYPEAHAFVTHKLNGKLAKGQSYLDGQTQPFISTPDKTAKTSYNLGLSITARPDPKMEYGIGYDLDLASKYIAHQGTLKVRVNF